MGSEADESIVGKAGRPATSTISPPSATFSDEISRRAATLSEIDAAGGAVRRGLWNPQGRVKRERAAGRRWIATDNR
jgi:hypothetical protein